MPPGSVTDWLAEVGFSEYIELFKRERLEISVLPDLTDSDLEKLGLPLGHRKRLLKAISVLAATHVADPAAAVPGQAERRQLTVMFCDLVGSTQLSQRLDPEVLRDLMTAYQQACGTVVARYEGHVAQYLGDGLMIYFGWPRAHEDDAERAVRTGIQLIGSVKQVRGPEELRVRIGIATGSVVVGETGAGDASVPKVAVGETPNIAARLQSLAGPDEIVISAATRKLIAAVFECEDLGEQSLKGVLEAVRAFRVRALAPMESRFEASHVGDLTAFIGRDEELSTLVRRWEAACDGEGQVVLLSGEPGIGKSRVIRELRGRVSPDSSRFLRCQCSPYYANSALHPFTALLERAAGLKEDELATERLEKLERFLSQLSMASTQAPALLAALLSIDASNRYPASKLSAQRQKEETLSLLAEIVWRLSKQRPVLFVFEDVHWIDPTSLELLDLFVAQIAAHRVLLVLSFRPEFPGRWVGQSNVTFLSLNRLARRQAAALAARVTQGKTLPEEVLSEIVAKTDGVPLFVEELTKAVVESGILRLEEGRYALTGPLTALAIPSTLQDSLMARLDRLSEMREVAQIGACIGREFSYRLVAAVAGLSGRNLQSALDQLTGSELVFRRGTPPDAIYSFKHALVQDAAYASLLKSRRQVLHQLIAGALEAHFPERIANEPEVAAHHFTVAGLNEQAVGYWLSAGQRATERFANAEAISHITRGLSLLSGLPPGPPRDKQELLLQMAMGSALGAKGYTSPEVGRTFARARELCHQVGEMPQMFPILFGLWIYYIMRAEFEASHQIASQLLELARSGNDPVGILTGCYSFSGTYLFRGDLQRARQYGEEALSKYEKTWDRKLTATFGFSAGPGAADWLTFALWFLGYPDKAHERAELTLKLARELDHPLTLATVLVHRAFWAGMRGDLQEALEFARSTIQLTRETGILIRQAEGELIEGWAIARLNGDDQGIVQLETSLALWHQVGANIADTVWLGFLADAHRARGRMDEAWKALNRAIECMEKYGKKLWGSGLYRLAGELCLEGTRKDAALAEKWFLRAIDVARSQSAKLLELEAASALAKLYCDQGRKKDGVATLQPVYNWFTEGFDRRPLHEGKKLLQALAR